MLWTYLDNVSPKAGFMDMGILDTSSLILLLLDLADLSPLMSSM